MYMHDQFEISNLEYLVIYNLMHKYWQIAAELVVKVNETWPAQLGVAWMGILFFYFKKWEMPSVNKDFVNILYCWRFVQLHL